MKEEALKLADALEALHQYVPSEAPAMIRRLVEELDKQGEPYCWEFCGTTFYDKEECFAWWEQMKKTGEMLSNHPPTPLYTTPQTKPTITKLDGKVVAVTMTDDEHRITEVLWEAPKPLSFDDMVELGKKVDAVWDVNINGSVWFSSVDAFESFCRAIEERHGIK